MNMNPDNPLNIPFPTNAAAPSTLTLLSLIREDINRAITPELSRKDEKAWVLVSSVANGVFVSAIALSKTGEYRFVDLELTTVMQMWELKGQQYHDSQKQNTDEKKISFADKGNATNDGGWFSVIFHVENDGFVSKTEYNYDKRVYSGGTPEQWFIAPEEPTEDYKSVWSDEEYHQDLAMFPRKSGNPDWLN
jgi:hypothetical protein